MYCDSASKSYIAVPGGSAIRTQLVTMTAADQAILSNPAADAPLEMKKNSPVSPITTGSPGHTSDSSASAASESAAGLPALEKKDDDDSSKKDKEEKPRSLAAIKVTHKLKQRSPNYETDK